jgi:hypothetical protein
MNLTPKVVKPKVSRTTTLRNERAWIAQCPCSFFFPLTWPTKDGKQAAYFRTQADAFLVALTHARREHWTPGVQP